jgi:hypothetical protein
VFRGPFADREETAINNLKKLKIELFVFLLILYKDSLAFAEAHNKVRLNFEENEAVTNLQGDKKRLAVDEPNLV